MRRQTFARDTWIEDEEACYPSGRQLRRGRAMFEDGKVRAIRAGIPDTFFSIPAHARVAGRYVAGTLMMREDESTGRPVMAFYARKG